jgi:protein-tyrosine phosphatase
MTRAELHFHLLPEVDDGPVDLDDAVALARLAVADGTGVVTVTPHVRDLFAQGILGELPARVREVQEALDAAGVPLAVRTGAELAHDDVPAFDARMLDAVAQGPPHARWVLIEAPLFGARVEEFLAGTAAVRAHGFGTLIGHPERCAALMERPEAIAAERRAGARLQVNASSLVGYHGPAEQVRGLALLRSGQADVIASDAHRAERPPRLSEALAVLAQHGIQGGEAYVTDVPRALLEHGIGAAPAVRAA